MSAAHRSASAMVFVGKRSKCGKIAKSTIPKVRSSAADVHSTNRSPIRGVITMLPALTPTQTVSESDGSRSASPDSRIQWHKYVASPPSTSSASASRTQVAHRSEPIVGNAVSSRTPSRGPPQPGEVPEVRLGGHQSPYRAGAAQRVTPLRRRNDQGVALGDLFAEKLHERRMDARVGDAARCEQQLQEASKYTRGIQRRCRP